MTTHAVVAAEGDNPERPIIIPQTGETFMTLGYKRRI